MQRDGVTNAALADAEQALRRRHYARALFHFDRHLSTSPEDAHALILAGRAAKRVDLDDLALRYYHEAEIHAPAHATSFTRRSCILLERLLGRRSPSSPNPEKRQISMRSLGHKGRFGNQILQYAFLRLYAKQFGLEVATGEWPGSYIFDLHDPEPVTPHDMISEKNVDMLSLFGEPEPRLAGKDITGFFQHDTGRWAQHRAQFQRMFTPCAELTRKIEKEIDRLIPGPRTLVALHLRRGDFVGNDRFAVAPGQWYRDWLEQLWPELQHPVLYIATDEPALIDTFAEFNPVSASSFDCGMQDLEFVVDWYLLRQADFLCASNSSFSLTAALANSTGRCFLRPEFERECLREYEPWQSHILDPMA